MQGYVKITQMWQHHRGDEKSSADLMSVISEDVPQQDKESLFFSTVFTCIPEPLCYIKNMMKPVAAGCMAPSASWSNLWSD